MSAVEEQPREGWALPGNATRFHYFRGSTALCHRWMFRGEVDGDDGVLGNGPGPEDCHQCWRARKKELAS